MELDQEQKDLLRHLVEESQMLLYDAENLSIWKRDHEVICQIKNGNSQVRVETEPDGTLVFRISENTV